jgi:DNA polymerase-3 subunit alpha
MYLINMKSYFALHNHNNSSFMDGIGDIESWVKSAREKNILGLGITNHGDGGELLNLYNEGKKQNYPVILGAEVYFIPDKEDKESKNTHLNLFVKNRKGYNNLCKLLSLGYEKDRFYYKPRIDFKDLIKYNEGLICTSACSGSIFGNLIKNKEVNYNLLGELTIQFLNIFKNDFYFEIQAADLTWIFDNKTRKFINSGSNFQEKVNKILIMLGKKYNIKVIITDDAHMVDKNYKIVQDIQMKNNYNDFCFYETYYLKTYEELEEVWKHKHPYVFINNKFDEYINNLVEIWNKCKDLKLDFSYNLPVVIENAGEKEIINKLLNKKILDFSNLKVKERLKFELNIICNNGILNFANYFLLLADVIEFCNINKIIVSPGRGSAAGSIINYGLGITKIDPLKYNLSFDRFLNIGRIKEGNLPDIDIDFGKPKLIKDYIINKYGKEKTANIGTINTLQLKSAIKDILRVYEIKVKDVNFITSKIEDNINKLNKIDYINSQLSNNIKLKEIIIKNPEILDIIYILVGQNRNRGKHASALVVSNEDINNFCPIFINKDNDRITQYNMSDVEKTGLIKFDILGLNTLNDIGDCIDLINLKYNLKLSIDYIINYKINDSKIYKEFQKGNTNNVFQFNTPVAKKILKLLPINNIIDLCNATSIGRTGIMDVGGHHKFIKRAKGKEKINYPHKDLEDILKETFGLFIYQEQVIESVKILANFNIYEADQVRAAMTKKNIEKLNQFKEKFIIQTKKKYNELNEVDIKNIWEDIESQAGYSFNKSHALSYAIVGYICKYLDFYFNLEYNCSVLMNEGDKNNLNLLLSKLNSENKIKLFDINESKENFYINNNKIIIPFSIINRMSEKSSSEIVKNQPYLNFNDFLNKINFSIIKKDIIINLILCDCFKNIEKDKEIIDLIKEFYIYKINLANKSTKEKLKQEYSDKFSNISEFNLDLLKKLAFSGIGKINYAKKFKSLVKNKCIINDYKSLLNLNNNSSIIFMGVIISKESFFTKKNQEMGNIILDDGLGNLVKLVVWPTEFKNFYNKINKDNLILVYGKLNIYNNEISIILNKVEIVF